MCFALGLILLSAAQLAYRFSLPTDGWAVITSELDHPDWIYWDNLVGAASPLQRGDTLLSVSGLDVQGGASAKPIMPPPDWIAGQSVEMTVRRLDTQLTVSIPLVHWSMAAWWRYNTTHLTTLVGFLGALVLAAVGLFTFWRRPVNPSARALLVLCAASFATSISGSLPDGLSVQFDRLAFWLVGFFSYAIFGSLIAPSILAFALLFPRPKRFLDSRLGLALFPYGLGAAAICTALVTGITSIAWVTAMLIILASLFSLVHAGFTQRDAVSRAQLRWAIGGFAAGLGLALLAYPPAFGWVTDPFWAELLSAGVSLGFTVVGISLSIAILRYRLFDIDVIIRRTLVYSVLTASLALFYFGCVALLTELSQAVTGQNPAQLVTVISTLAIAGLFNPLRQRIQDFIDRRFFRKKYNAELALASFAKTARDEVELDALTAELLRVARESVQPEQVSLWLKPGKTGNRWSIT